MTRRTRAPASSVPTTGPAPRAAMIRGRTSARAPPPVQALGTATTVHVSPMPTRASPPATARPVPTSTPTRTAVASAAVVATPRRRGRPGARARRRAAAPGTATAPCARTMPMPRWSTVTARPASTSTPRTTRARTSAAGGPMRRPARHGARTLRTVPAPGTVTAPCEWTMPTTKRSTATAKRAPVFTRPRTVVRTNAAAVSTRSPARYGARALRPVRATGIARAPCEWTTPTRRRSTATARQGSVSTPRRTAARACAAGEWLKRQPRPGARARRQAAVPGTVTARCAWTMPT